MTDATQLREALDVLYEQSPDDRGLNTTPVRWPLDVIGDAARTIALPILEGDPELVERCFDAIKDDTLFVASIPDRLVAGKDLGRLEREVVAIGLVDAVLAALIPEKGEGE